jgi:hypothetical protein
VEGWLEIPTGVTENLFGVACLDKNEVVAGGENGKILKTVDSGDSWTVKFEKTGYDMIHVAFADAQIGYACGDSCWWNSDNHKGVIVKTTNGGETWQELPNRSLSIWNGLIGFVPAICVWLTKKPITSLLKMPSYGEPRTEDRVSPQLRLNLEW